jgi:hypothetical protein
MLRYRQGKSPLPYKKLESRGHLLFEIYQVACKAPFPGTTAISLFVLKRKGYKLMIERAKDIKIPILINAINL